MLRMSEQPPVDFVVAGWLKAKAPKTLSEQASLAGLPVKKGKVKKRGNISR